MSLLLKPIAWGLYLALLPWGLLLDIIDPIAD